MLDLLLPQRCLACGRSGAAVCDACLESLPWIEPPLCERCGARPRGRSAAAPNAPAAASRSRRPAPPSPTTSACARIVAGWKEHGLRRLAATAADLVAAAIPRPPVEALTYVPADRDSPARARPPSRASASRESSASAGSCPSSTHSRARGRGRASAARASPTDAATSAPRSRPRPSARRARSVSWTTSTRPARPRPRAPRRSEGSAPAGAGRDVRPRAATAVVSSKGQARRGICVSR